MSKIAAFFAAFVAAFRSLFAATPEVDPYEGYELTEADRGLLCPWDCGECRYCREGRDPDLG